VVVMQDIFLFEKQGSIRKGGRRPVPFDRRPPEVPRHDPYGGIHIRAEIFANRNHDRAADDLDSGSRLLLVLLIGLGDTTSSGPGAPRKRR